MDLSDLVNLPGTTVADVTKMPYNEVYITVETTEKYVPCRLCGKDIRTRHGCDKERKLRHLPVFGRPTFIIYKPHRYICEDCDDRPTTTATPIWHKPNSAYTIDYETHILMELVNSTIADVCVKERLSESSVKGILDRHIEGTVVWSMIKYIGVLGIDEIALKKGHKGYVTLITCRHEGVVQLLSVIKGREKAEIKRFFKTIPRKLMKTAEAVCTDMYDGYVNAAKEAFKKKTIIVIDRFHVAKLYRKEPDQYRQKILNELKSTLPSSEYEKLKGAMHVLRKGNECSSKKEKAIVNELFSHSPELAEAYRLGLKLTQIFNAHMTKEEAVKKFTAWIKEVRSSHLSCFNKFIKTFRKYKNEIANYFIDRNTSAFVEGINQQSEGAKAALLWYFQRKTPVPKVAFRYFRIPFILIWINVLAYTGNRGEPKEMGGCACVHAKAYLCERLSKIYP